MTNRDIALTFKLLADLMELHGENSFKVKSYFYAYQSLKKYEKDLNLAFSNEIEAIPGIGKTVAEKINELLNTDRLSFLDQFLAKTPEGVVQMLKVRGLGPKKVKAIWKELNVEDISELLLACNENRLVEVKGFGFKTQEDIKNKIEFFLSSAGKYHFASIAGLANELILLVKQSYPDELIEITGLLRRKMPIVESIEILSTVQLSSFIENLNEEKDTKLFYKHIPVFIEVVDRARFGNRLYETSTSPEFRDASNYNDKIDFSDEQDVFKNMALPYIDAAFREDKESYFKVKESSDFRLIALSDIKGVVHNHSTYSDGLNTLKDMAKACIDRGYQYFVISDHSASAFYANGLKEERVYQQWKEIDELNKKFTDFKIFKSIESDILNDGNLDYDDSILQGFDLIIASIHSNLKMDEVQATSRLIKAIENPHTDILGHPTGRLLLGRNGYPIDHKKTIDACAANDVAIELNANPQRLDMDWTWIPYAISKNVKISINPDAHSISQIDNIKYGVYAATKGGLTKDNCLNAMELSDFEKWTKR